MDNSTKIDCKHKRCYNEIVTSVDRQVLAVDVATNTSRGVCMFKARNAPVLSIDPDERIGDLLCQLRTATFQHRFLHRFGVTLPDRFIGTAGGLVISLYEVKPSEDGSELMFSATTTLGYRPRWSRRDPVWNVYALKGVLVRADRWAGTAEIRPALVIRPH